MFRIYNDSLSRFGMQDLHCIKLIQDNCYLKTDLQTSEVPARVMPNLRQNEMNKYCSCHYEYIYKCPDFCDDSGNEL